MAIFEKFPYTDLHNLNLDWMINQFKEWEAKYAKYDAELNELKTAVENAQAALDQDERDLTAALGRLQTALAALPSDIQAEVAEQIRPEVASKIGPTVAAQLPAVAKPMVEQEVSEWLRNNMTKPPLDPSMSIRSAVPDAKDCGEIFTFLEDLEISGYTRVTKNKQPTILAGKCWDEAEATGLRTQSGVDAYLIGGIIGGVTYQLDNFYNGTGIPSGYTFRAAFVRDYTSGQALDGVVVYHNRTEMAVAGRWNDDETSFRLRAPFGATALLINQVSSRGTVSISELSNEFIGNSGEEVNVTVPLGALNVFTTHYDEVARALDNSGNVYFKFPADTYDGMTAQVAAFKKNAGLNYSIVLVGPSDKLIKADMTYNSTTLGGQLVNVTEVALGGGGGGSTSSVVINLTAGQNNTFTGDIALSDLQTSLDNADPIWLSYPGATDNDYDLRQVVEYNQDLTDDTSLRIGVFSEDEYIVYSVLNNGNNGITLTVVSEKGIGGEVINLTAIEGGYYRGDIDIKDFETDLNMGIPVWLSYPDNSQHGVEQITRWRRTFENKYRIYLFELSSWYGVTGTAGSGTITITK